MNSYKVKYIYAIVFMFCICLTSCSSKTEEKVDIIQEEVKKPTTALGMMEEYNQRENQVLEDKYRTFYEVFVYSFFDSDGDGIGDLNGLTQKLDYIEELGFNGIWLMPIMPSTTYHKYDVIDYYDIDGEYGSMTEFEGFMKACEERNIHVLIDLVMNHTSSQHEWFITACDYLRSIGDQEPNIEECPYIEYYFFTKEKPNNTYYSIPETDWYYEGSFWSEMPDLNLLNQDVRKEFEQITAFWLEKGVAGFRIDAAKEFEADNTTANVEILSWLNEYTKTIKEDSYIVAEVWTDMNTYEKYYASGIDSVFNFAFAEQSGIIASTLNQVGGMTASGFGKSLAALDKRFSEYNVNYVDAPFYTNHDLGRSAGYYSGEGSDEKTKIALSMNLMMNGAAFVYYGEELGMKGSGKDENKRAPMYWTENGEGMCTGPADMDTIKMKYPSLEEQMKDENSIYYFVREAIKLRNSYPAIARGEVEFVDTLSDNELCVIRKTYQEEDILLVWNLGEGEKAMDMSDLFSGVIGGALLTGTVNIVEDEGSIVLPGYSMILIQIK